jgi:hypothetical protein
MQTEGDRGISAEYQKNENMPHKEKYVITGRHLLGATMVGCQIESVRQP